MIVIVVGTVGQKQWNEDGTPTPTIYGEPVEAYITYHSWMPAGKEIVVHYLDGRKEWFGVFIKE